MVLSNFCKRAYYQIDLKYNENQTITANRISEFRWFTTNNFY